MTRRLWLALALAALPGCGRGDHAAAPAPGAGAPSAEAPTAGQVVEQYAAARGGHDRMLSLETVRMSGRIASFRGQSGVPVTVERKRAGGRYLCRIAAAGGPVVAAVDGATAWELDPAGGIPRPRRMEPARAARLLHQVPIEGPLIAYAQQGGRLALVGRERLAGAIRGERGDGGEGTGGGTGGTAGASGAGAEVYHLRLTYSDGAAADFLIDAKSFLLLRLREAGAVTSFSDYRKVDGLGWPFAERTVPFGDAGDAGDAADDRGAAARAPAGRSTAWDTVELNVSLPDGDFQLPR